ncbi:hypothetical protein DFA_05764 [Cavenderia fasciculata]|uniref:Homeobox domain-containing protein n=1 Tax=Cavenderia fasciculata TaxID=261658 RepID=F4PMI3_CACFS|nr:uncharacterized protein DFA_05764 [Cavenderia fasciculata]EGG23630.1 hypothetical protein DFA_05764 [Cavenderia fasciculata]|eukprot:XP_004361481.1 hypothetical protein DFA_05764 [Cavenderia fasciculata]
MFKMESILYQLQNQQSTSSTTSTTTHSNSPFLPLPSSSSSSTPTRNSPLIPFSQIHLPVPMSSSFTQMTPPTPSILQTESSLPFTNSHQPPMFVFSSNGANSSTSGHPQLPIPFQMSSSVLASTRLPTSSSSFYQQQQQQQDYQSSSSSPSSSPFQQQPPMAIPTVKKQNINQNEYQDDIIERLFNTLWDSIIVDPKHFSAKSLPDYALFKSLFLKMMGSPDNNIIVKQYLEKYMHALATTTALTKQLFSEVDHFSGRYIAVLKMSSYEPATSGSVRSKTKTTSGALSKSSKSVLLQWVINHLDDPYPPMDVKRQLAAESGQSIAQVSNWFINFRRRSLEKLKEQVASHQIEQSTGGPSSSSNTSPIQSDDHLSVATLPVNNNNNNSNQQQQRFNYNNMANNMMMQPTPSTLRPTINYSNQLNYSL